MVKVPYRRPQVVDHGSLVALTADFDVNFVGSLAKTVMLAQVSNPMAPPGGEGPGGDAPGFVPSGDELPDGGSGGSGTDITAEGGGSGGDVLTDRGSGGGAAPGGGGGGAGGGSGGGVAGVAAAPEKGGKLPFTGYAALTVAGLGAAFTSTGVAIRAALRRRS